MEVILLERIAKLGQLGEKVRVKSGVLQGVQGTLVRRSGGDRFVLSFETINQHAAIQVSAEDLEPVRA